MYHEKAMPRWQPRAVRRTEPVVAAIAQWRDRAQRYVDRELWLRHDDLGFPAVLGRRALQLMVIVVQGVTRDQILLRTTIGGTRVVD